MKLEGKIINFLGDSITEGAGVTDPMENRYDRLLLKECGLAAAYNYGISGTRLAHKRIPSPTPRYDLCFCGRAYDMNPDADVVVVFGGVNDYLHGDAPLGVFGDETPETFHGAVHFLMTFLKEKYAGKTVVFMTPAHCCFREISDASPVSDPRKGDTQPSPLQAYVDVIKAQGRVLGVPVLDLFTELGFDPNRPEDLEKYTVDGLHPNNAGHRMLADALKRFLEAL